MTRSRPTPSLASEDDSTAVPNSTSRQRLCALKLTQLAPAPVSAMLRCTKIKTGGFAMQGRPRRSVLYVPGSNERALEKARSLPADALIFDLEDSVAPDA